MTEIRNLSPGARVRVKGNPSGIELRSANGEIVWRDSQDGYFIVRLDEPALVCDVPDIGEEITEIVEAIDNLEMIQPDR